MLYAKISSTQHSYTAWKTNFNQAMEIKVYLYVIVVQFLLLHSYRDFSARPVVVFFLVAMVVLFDDVTLVIRPIFATVTLRIVTSLSVK